VGNPADPAEDGTALLEPWMTFSQNASRLTSAPVVLRGEAEPKLFKEIFYIIN